MFFHRCKRWSSLGLPLTVIPTNLHFWNRQYWHCVRVFLVIIQSLFLTHLYFKSSPLIDRRKNFFKSFTLTLTMKIFLCLLPCMLHTLLLHNEGQMIVLHILDTVQIVLQVKLPMDLWPCQHEVHCSSQHN